VIAYRICQAARAATTAEMIAGKGGAHSSGRWHTAGKPIVHASQNLSLAAHEISVHYPKRKHALKFVMSAIEIPDATVLTLAALA
jgi:RES domain-containing protein